MAVHFALRSRIRLDPDPPARKREVTLPPLTLPIVLYWGVMGALTWSVFTGSLRLDGLLDARTEPTATDHWATATEPYESAPVAARTVPIPPADLAAADAPRAASPAPDLERAPAAASEEPAPTPTSREPEAKGPPTKEPAAPMRDDGAHADRPVRSAGLPSLEMARRTPVEPRGPHDGTPPTPAPAPAPAPGPDRDEPAPSGGLPSCEAAAASAGDTYDLSAPSGSRTPDVTRDTYAGILENGAYLSPCSVPASTRIGVCVAVKGGRATGITVTLQPGNDRVRACVTRAVQKLRFPSSPRLDVTRTTFEATR